MNELLESHSGMVCAPNYTDGRDVRFSFTITQNGCLEIS